MRDMLEQDEVLRLTTWSRATLYRKIDARMFPRPVKDNGRNVWRADDVEKWRKERVAELNDMLAHLGKSLRRRRDTSELV